MRTKIRDNTGHLLVGNGCVFGALVRPEAK
jgi:hypothetical protein